MQAGDTANSSFTHSYPTPVDLRTARDMGASSETWNHAGNNDVVFAPRLDPYRRDRRNSERPDIMGLPPDRHPPRHVLQHRVTIASIKHQFTAE